MKLKTFIGLFIGSLTTFFLLSLLSNKLNDKEYWFHAVIYLLFMSLTFLIIHFVQKGKASKKTDSF
ncbi:hypothetical protein [Gottfriedia luciferensis]|uniref:hypothetical protein n=1 Tax=Gottfriedia luciferensis TaxID=178774 RepID=UPI000B4305B0|nr:hypothetical protein [Gottfriedia luciferensis]